MLRSALGISLLLATISPASCSRQGDETSGISTHLPVPAPHSSSGPAAHVVVISIDGLRADALDSAAHLLQLCRDGTSCPEAETIADSETLPAHTSMLTGLEAARHGVTWNDARPGTVAHPTMFSVASDAGLSMAMLFSKDKFHYFVRSGSVHWTYGPARGGNRFLPAGDIATAFSREWPQGSYQLTFVHLGDADLAGHSSGWLSPDYLAAVRRADAAVGVILETIRSSSRAGSTAVIVTADHGGHDRGHYAPGSRRLDDLLIPWICRGPGVGAGRSLNRTIRIQDTAPTALRLLGLKFSAAVDGREVTEVFR